MFFSFILKQKRYVLLIFYLLFSLFLMIISSSPAIKVIRGTVFNIFTSISSGFNEVRHFILDSWNSINTMKDLKRELQLAYEKINLLQDASVTIAALQSENNYLKDLLGYSKRLKWKNIPAQIIVKDPRYYFNNIIVNKGANDGVNIHMPVIAWQEGQSGLVGKVIETGAHSSKIMLITDQNFWASGMIEKSYYTGLLHGQGTRNQHLEFVYVDRNARANFGDMVVTSGQGGLFPKGIPVGVIMNVEDARYGPYYKKITVLPVVDFNKLESVFILINPVSEEILKMRDSKIE